MPAATALREAVEERDRRTFADHLIVEPDVIPFKQHG
jgi:hypothetical protein